MSYLGRSAKLSLKAQEKVSFLATAGQTVKTGLSYVPNFVEVYVNGILLTDTTDFTATNGNSVTFTVALALNDEVTVVSLKTFTVADHYTISAANTLLAAKAPLASPNFTGGIDVTGTVTADGLDVGFNQNIQLGSDTYPLRISRTGAGALVSTISDGYDLAATRLDFVMREGSANEVTALSITGSGNVGIGTSTPSGNLQVAYSGAVNRNNLILSTPNDGVNYKALVGGNLAVDASGTYTTPATNISGGGIEFGSVNNSNAHGTIRFLSAPDTNTLASTPTERMRIDAAGIVTKPYQPAFHAMAGAQINTTSSTGVIIVEFSSALVNTGGHYSTTNDRFTAPVAGVYKFSVGWMSMDNIVNRFGFFKNGSLQGNVGYAQGQSYQRATYEVCINLAVNDYVDFRTNINGGVEGSIHQNYRYFTGYLIG